MDRLKAEIELIRLYHPDAEHTEDYLWVRLPVYRIRHKLWEQDQIEIVFQVPPGYPGAAPYGFFVRPFVRAKNQNQLPGAYQEPFSTPFGDGWGKFSWQHANWRSGADLLSGSNLMDFIRTFDDRFKEGA